MSVDDIKKSLDSLFNSVDITTSDFYTVDIVGIESDKNKLVSEINTLVPSPTLSKDEIDNLRKRMVLMTNIILKLKDYIAKQRLVDNDEAMINNINNAIAKNPSMKSSLEKGLTTLMAQKDSHEKDATKAMLEYNSALVSYKKVTKKGVVPTPPKPTPAPPTPTPKPKPTPTPTPTPSPKPAPPTGKPKTPINSLQFYIDQGILPKMDSADMIRICNELGIKNGTKSPTDLNFTINSRQLDRLLYAKGIREQRIKNELEVEGNKIKKGYKEIGRLNRETYNKARGAEFKETRRRIRTADSERYADAKRDKAKLDALDSNDLSTFLALDDSRRNKRDIKASEAIEEKQKLNDKELRINYKKLDKLTSALESSRKSKNFAKITEIRIERKIKKLESTIAKLQAKQGRLSDKQTMIINKSTKRYIDKVTRQQRAYIREQQRVANYVDRVNEINKENNDLIAERNRIARDVKKKKKFNVADRAAMRINGAMITARVAALRASKITVNVEEEISSVLEGGFSR